MEKKKREKEQGFKVVADHSCTACESDKAAARKFQCLSYRMMIVQPPWTLAPELSLGPPRCLG
jgi:hypothetical protein